MKRAILVALAIGTVITSAAALSIGTAAPKPVAAAQTEFERSRSAWSAREEMRARVETRYLAARAQCESLGGLKRDKCLISAHASKGHALMEIQAPYEMR